MFKDTSYFFSCNFIYQLRIYLLYEGNNQATHRLSKIQMNAITFYL